MGQAARQAAEDAKAAAEGVKEGWNRDHAHPLNLNSAPEERTSHSPRNFTRPTLGKIIRGRPYRSKDELVTRGILSDDDYSRIRDYVSTD